MSEPHWMATARAQIGLRETPGPRNTAAIIAWAQRLGGWIASFYREDSIPWCGLFIANVMREAGLPVRQDALRAKSWASHGSSLLQGAPGAILVFSRAGGGHVGFYVAEDSAAYHVLGGNQSDAVSIVRIAKSRLMPGGIRWPSSAVAPGAPRIVPNAGALSRNEA